MWVLQLAKHPLALAALGAADAQASFAESLAHSPSTRMRCARACACACALDVHKRGCVLACVRLLVSSRCALVRFIPSLATERWKKRSCAACVHACPVRFRRSCARPCAVIALVGCVRVRRDGATPVVCAVARLRARARFHVWSSA